MEVDEGPAAVALIDGGVCLDEVCQEEAPGLEAAVQGADDAQGDRGAAAEAEGVADGNDPVADSDGIGVREGEAWEGLIGVQLEDGEVGGLVVADDLGVDRSPQSVVTMMRWASRMTW